MTRSLALVSILVVACSTPSGRTDGPTSQVEVAPVVASSAPAASTSATPAELACARLRDLQTRSRVAATEQARRAGAGKETPNDLLPESEVAQRLEKETGACKPAGRGAWALVVERISPMPWDGWNGVQVLLSLAYADATSVRSRVTPFERVLDGGPAPKEDNFYFSNVDGAEVKSLLTFDYDGDGAGEVALVLSGKYHEGESWAWGRVYGVKDGAVRPYAPAASISFSSVVDVDGDARPDLVGGEPWDDVVENCCSGFTGRLDGPPLVAHALPDGTFSRNDAVALSFAKRACPARPVEIVPGGAKGWDVGSLHGAVTCARLWGVDGDEILAAIDKTVGPPKPVAKKGAAAAPNSDCDMTRCVNARDARDHAVSWVVATPPLTLR